MKKTAEEIFNEASKGKYIFGSVDLKIAKDQHHVVYNAMEEYKDQHTAPLVEALEEAKLQIEYLHRKFSKTGSGESVLSRIETALLNAKA